MILTGQCQCEKLRFELKQPPLFTHACHCLNCQRRSGSAFSITSFVVLSDLMLVHGGFTKVQTSPRTTMHKCDQCGTTIYAWSTSFPHTVIVPRGTMDDRALSPQAHIWMCRKQSWISLSPHIPQFDREYVREQVWPEESLARINALGD